MLYRDEQLIIPYLEGTLDPKRREKLEARIRRDPRFAREVENVRRLKYVLHEAAANVPNAQPGDRSSWPQIASQLPVRRPGFSYGRFALAASVSAAAVVVLALPGHFAIQQGKQVAQIDMNSGITSALSSRSPVRKQAREAVDALLDTATRFSDGSISATILRDPFVAPQIPAVRDVPIKLPGMSQIAMTMHGSNAAYVTRNPFSPPASLGMDYDMTGEGRSTTYRFYDATPQKAVPLTIMNGSAVTVAENDISSDAGKDSESSTAPASTASLARATVSNLDANMANVETVNGPVAGSGGDMQEPVVAQEENGAYADDLRLASMSSDGPAPPSQGTIDSQQALMSHLQDVSDQASADASDGSTSVALARWMSVLEATTSSSIYGNDSAAGVAAQALQSARSASLLVTLKQELEQWQGQDGQNVGVMRMLAALYQADGDSASALGERRKAVALDSAIGEDWFQAGLAEEQAGNNKAAGADYAKALQSGDMSNPLHENFARQQIPQMDL